MMHTSRDGQISTVFLGHAVWVSLTYSQLTFVFRTPMELPASRGLILVQLIQMPP